MNVDFIEECKFNLILHLLLIFQLQSVLFKRRFSKRGNMKTNIQTCTLAELMIPTVQPKRNAQTKFSYNQFAHFVAFSLHVNLARISSQIG